MTPDEMFNVYDGYVIQDTEQPGIQVRVSECNLCGSIVHDLEKHFAFHTGGDLYA